MPEFQAPVGTRDVLPPESARWAELVALLAAHATAAGYGLVVSPMFEDVGVFQRVGESTDVVRKEMYEFFDKGNPPRHLALRPEGTASVVRAYIQRRPALPFKAWYAAPSFRYEKPQAGRYRQHHQLGVEVLGSDDPDVDVEVIALAWTVYRALGLTRVRLGLNSLGDAKCAPAYADALRAHLDANRDRLCPEHRDRYSENPKRVLDCKRAACIAATESAPRLVDHLCAECEAHFARVRQGLEVLGVPFEIAPRLVRGLDYYTRTTFEFAADALESAQNAIGGGGRYDGLTEALGGPPTPGIGFGLGIERILLACDAEGVFPAPVSTIDVFVVDTTDGMSALRLTETLRRAGIATDRAFDHRSMKSQFKLADRSGARIAVVVGEQELAEGTVTMRDLGTGKQEAVRSDDVVQQVRKRLSQS